MNESFTTKKRRGEIPFFLMRDLATLAVRGVVLCKSYFLLVPAMNTEASEPSAVSPNSIATRDGLKAVA